MVYRNGGPAQWFFVTAVLLLLLSSGCLSGVQGPSVPNESNDSTLNDTDAHAGQSESEPRGNDTESDDAALPAVNTTAADLVGNSAAESSLSPKPFPERPERLTANATEQFVADYEVAYLWNERLDNETTEFEFNTYNLQSQLTDDGGFVVSLRVGYVHRIEPNAVGDGAYSVHYFVNESVVQRSLESSNYLPGEGLRGVTTLERCVDSCDDD